MLPAVAQFHPDAIAAGLLPLRFNWHRCALLFRDLGQSVEGLELMSEFF